MVVFEEYDTGDDTGAGAIYDDDWVAQTFTVQAGESHTIEKVKLKMYRIGSPGTVTVSIRATSGDHPTGGDLTSGTIDGDTFTTDSAGAWYTITLTEYDLSASTKYAIVIRALAGDIVNHVHWREDETSPTYAGGNKEYSFDGGSSWSTASGSDKMFEEWGRNTSTFYINTLTVSPSKVDRVGSNSTTLTTTFHDDDDLAADQYTATFSVREPDDSTEHTGLSGTVAKDGAKEYSATYSLDPDSTFAIGKYDLKVVVTAA